MKFLVIGLGTFGSALSQQLVETGHEVIGVDSKMELVDKYKHSITHTIALDATSRQAMEQLPLRDLDAAIVGIGENEGATIMTTALLKQMNVERIICRVTSPTQKTVLEAMNITEFVYPEASSAERLAMKLDLPGVLESFKIQPDYRILEVGVPERYVGRTIEELELADKYQLVLITILKAVVKKNIYGDEKKELVVQGMISPTATMRAGDVMLLFGKPKDLERFVEG